MKVFKNGIMLQKYKSRLVFSLNQLTLLVWESLGAIEYCLVKQPHFCLIVMLSYHFAFWFTGGRGGKTIFSVV